MQVHDVGAFVKAKFVVLQRGAQVELQGSYSTQRVLNLLRYSSETSNLQVLLVLLITPMPCLVIITAVDSMHLRPVADGLAVSHRFFARAFIAFWIASMAVYIQFKRIVPPAPLSNTKIFSLSVAVSALTVSAMYGLTLAIGFPLPFSIITVSPIWLSFYALPLVVWIKNARGDPATRSLLSSLLQLNRCQEALVIIYPAYFYAFTSIPAKGKPAFAMLLPVMKLVFRHLMSRIVKHMSDEVPIYVTINVEVFSALFVSYCAQNTPSMHTTIGLMVIDAVQMSVSLVDIERIARRLKLLRKQIDGKSSTDKSQERVKSDFYLAHDIINHHQRMGPSVESLLLAPTEVWMTTLARQSSTVQPLKIVTFNTEGSRLKSSSNVKLGSSRNRNRKISATRSPQVQYMEEMRRVLYITEFVVLLNFVEVIVPFIFSMYLVAMYHLPNRAYYEQIATMDDSRFRKTLFNVMLYTALQLLSLLVLNVVLWYRMRFSVVRQLAFVLQTHWVDVHMSIIFWVFYNVQTSLQHFGYDYTFKFAWLRQH